MDNREKILVVVLTIMLAVLYFDTFTWLVESWLTEPDYSHGFLVPIVSAFFIWRKRHILKHGEKDFDAGMLVLGAGLFLYVVGDLRDAVFISSVSFMVVLSGLIALFCGKAVLKEWVFPLCVLIFMIPLPYIEVISAYLQLFTAGSSTSIAHGLGIDAANDGNAVSLGSGEVIVGEDCSGLRLMIPLFALASIFVYMLACRLQIKIFLLSITVPIAITANVLRVTLTILIADYYGLGAGAAFFHYFSGIFFFITSIALLIIIAKLLKCTNHFGKNIQG
ncbi:MAG: hypothetical protein A7315_00740 [Candidatus Altiarchaeales archaeon WOR_SM1_79]|nr:MAG: hypothetical protein A7315_00740 [Candidatus Altiarchaeales archaeon WOR_SM1_79]